MIYLIVFAITSLLLMVSDQKRGTKKKVIAFIALSFPIMLATLRSETVGVDVHTYVKPMFDCIRSASNIKDYIALMKANPATSDLEWGFIFVGYLFGKLTNSMNGVFFIYSTITICCVYSSIIIFNTKVAAKAKLRQVPTWMGMFVFLTCFYNMSLTMVRQSVATSCVLLAVMFCLANEYKKTVALSIVAFFMHSTAIFIVALLSLYYIVNKNKRIIKLLYWLFLLFFVVFGQQFYFFLLSAVNKFIPVSERYLSANYMDFSGNDVNLAWIYLILVSVFSSWLVYSTDSKNRIKKYLFFLMLTQLLLVPLSIISANAGRILYYYMYFVVLTVPIMRNRIRGSKTSNTVATGLVILFGLVYWTFTVGVNDMTATLTYSIGFY